MTGRHALLVTVAAGTPGEAAAAVAATGPVIAVEYLGTIVGGTTADTR